MGSSEERQTQDRKNTEHEGCAPQTLLKLVGCGASGQSAGVTSRRSSGSNPSPRTPEKRPVIEWRRELGLPECPYLTRWLVDLRLFSIRLHHWTASDDMRALHDHPWSFITVVLKGYYSDCGPLEKDHLHTGSIRFRRAEHQHSVMIPPKGCWTLVFTGPQRRKWGFWPGGKFRKANKYFFMYGHHPCE